MPPQHHPSELSPAVRLLREFLNTREMAAGTDQLSSAEGLSAWLASVQGSAADLEWVPGDREWVVAVREALRDVLSGHNGAAVPPASIALLNRAAGRAPLVARWDGAGNVTVAAAGGGVAAAVGRIWAAAVAAQAEGTWPRLKACRRGDCRWIFLDQSKNHSAAWCTTAGCGALMKARAYRRRRAGAGQPADRTSVPP